MKVISKREDAPKKRSIDPKNIKKRSQIVKDSGYYSPVVRNGMAPTTTGFIKEGFSDTKFEVSHEIMNSGTVSALVKHPAKTRTIQVISGPGIAFVEEEDGSFKELRIHAGDSVVFEPGKAYKISTTGRYPLEFVSVQHAKYSARMETLEEAFVSNIFTEVPHEVQQREPRRRRGESKAVQQLEQQRQQRGQPQVTKEPAKEPAQAPETRAAAVVGVNPRPSMGNFDAESAG